MMGQEFYLCQSGTGDPIAPEQRSCLDSHIDTLPAFSGWKESGFLIVTDSISLSDYRGYLVILISDRMSFPKDDVRQLVEYGRTIGLNLFVDIGDPECEMPLDEIEEMLGKLRAL